MKKLFLSFFLFSSGLATNEAPWFGNVWEMEWTTGYKYYHADTVSTPTGSFDNTADNHSLTNSLALAPWPNWNVETELYLTHTNQVIFGYEAALITGRYQWLDDITGDPISLTTGLTFSFPGNRFTHDLHFYYIGDYNTELHFAIGKEIPNCGLTIWVHRFWAYGAYGIANRGSGWLHGKIGWDLIVNTCLDFEVFAHALYGFGTHNIVPNEPFTGYGPIAYREIDLGAKGNYHLRDLGTLSLEAACDLYNRNSPNSYEITLSLLIPFSL